VCQQRAAVPASRLDCSPGFEMEFKFQIEFKSVPNLDQPNEGIPKLKKWQVKYGCVHLAVKNNFPDRNYLKFGTKFELKIRNL
jgi:hypothetical protein